MSRIDIPQRVLLGPGPSEVPWRVLQALAKPTIGHLDPVFLTLMDQVRARLRQLFRTDNELTLPMSGTGSAGMETVLVNLIEPGDTVLIAVNGVFGGRMTEVARRAGAEVIVLERPWGHVFEQEALIAALAEHRPALVALVHAETSTGACQPLEGLAGAVREHDALLVVDCVTSLGGMPVEVDAWGIDAAYSGTQKCLSCPPGLAPITLSPRAVAKLEARTTPVQSWYLDLSLVASYWGHDRTYHHTAPINMIYGLHEALELVFEESLEHRFARHQQLHELLRDGLAELEIDFICKQGERLPMLNAVYVPSHVEDVAVRRRLLDDYGIEIGGGLGEYRGRAWRIGLMGASASRRNVRLLLAAFREILLRN